MDIITFTTIVFTLTDDWLSQQPPVRRSGPPPLLSDSEVLTIEVVGEFLSLDDDKTIFNHFRRHFAAEFPTLKKIHRTTFTRQAANLWRVKEKLWGELLTLIRHDPQLAIVDSMPVEVCRFARAYRCRLFETEATYGYDHVARQRFYGFRLHLRLCWPGVIVGFLLAPAHHHDLDALPQLTAATSGYLLGDRNYWSPKTKKGLAQQGVTLLAPYKSKKREKVPWPLWLTQKRQRIETVIGQLCQRFNGHKTWARDHWHLCSRWLRKILAHTFGVYIAQLENLESPLRFDELFTH